MKAIIPEAATHCVDCGSVYSPAQELSAATPQYIDAPYHYERAAMGCCLRCWLGVGPGNAAHRPPEPSTGSGTPPEAA